jgi:hypothetical protein
MMQRHRIAPVVDEPLEIFFVSPRDRPFKRKLRLGSRHSE